MKTGFLLVGMMALFFLNHPVSGQSQKVGNSFPTYDQIRQKDRDTYDYVNWDGKARVVETDSINLFDYPSGTVTYILNGKPSDDVRYVKRVLAKKGTQVEKISISKAGPTARHVVTINYEVH
ncbi:hypothetical protein [Larkinella terrae]|uniref:Uncharacterized protein n=1 Tax=Larkinella terrae TaxID=2025311 RepID=A0A7K0EVH4_9BACT|nr:hypothetical protein [Larkinella terrae]MRS65813.1 hypothetical protein [Larkinella terrae]